MRQLTTDDAKHPEQTEGREALHDAVVEAIRLITPKELCFRLGITSQYLSEAIEGKNRKGFRTDWLVTVILMAPIDAVPPILRALGELRSYEFTRRRVMTETEELVRTREAMKRIAPGLLDLIDKEIGK